MTNAAPVGVGRRIAVCLDGTSNKYARDKTNVVKLYEMLDRDRSDQLSYYQPGIGTMPPPSIWNTLGRLIVARLDLAIAWLLEQHVCDAYRFLMRTYEPGDSIFLFGFSRGAYTARALAGMIHKVGLLTRGNEELIPFAWDTYKRKDDWGEAAGFKKTFARTVPLHFLGLWDTVRSIGWIWNPESLQFTRDNPSVEIVRHAIALDERRAHFPQNRWTDQKREDQDVLEMWFPGVHCDVGGGYLEKDSGLSKIGLQWMAGEAQAAGLHVDASAKARILPEQDTKDRAAPRADAKIHESLRGLWWILEFVPKPYQDPVRNFARRWMIHAGRHRYVPDDAEVNPAVAERMRLVVEYRPPNLPTGR
ncbi:MAG TPA: DUF2235 domain-containing protein [Candidatus Polarisedimenticolaceae bacterium]|nr:DUF2235 domain-containing protein [Candidatus Polarisedimenticolaceae bacterium]